MAVTQSYSHASVAVTALNSLSGGAWASGAEIDNSSGTYQEILIGGVIAFGSSHVAGDVVRIYIRARHSATSTDTTGAISGDDIADEAETEGTDFSTENLIPIGEVHCDAASDAQHWGPWSIAALFGGHMPEYCGPIFHNVDASAALAASGHSCDINRIQYTSA
ncbi:MAG: hypothetical protein ACPGVG_13405 [Mycobacterium sp.]